MRSQKCPPGCGKVAVFAHVRFGLEVNRGDVDVELGQGVPFGGTDGAEKLFVVGHIISCQMGAKLEAVAENFLADVTFPAASASIL